MTAVLRSSRSVQCLLLPERDCNIETDERTIRVEWDDRVFGLVRTSDVMSHRANVSLGRLIEELRHSETAVVLLLVWFMHKQDEAVLQSTVAPHGQYSTAVLRVQNLHRRQHSAYHHLLACARPREFLEGGACQSWTAGVYEIASLRPY